MNDDFISNILDSLERNIHISQENIDDFIGTLFEQRAEDMHTSVTKSEKYKNQLKKVHSVNDKILSKYENAKEIIEDFEESQDVHGELGELIEKEMYKYGLYDGMKLMIEGMKK